MITVKLGEVELKLSKNEAKEIQRINDVKGLARSGVWCERAQQAADIWMRSAPTQAAQDRRKAAVKAIGLSDEIKFL